MRAVGTAPLRYTWVKDGVDMFSTGGATLRMISLTQVDYGTYVCRCDGPGGQALSEPVVVAAPEEGIDPEVRRRWRSLGRGARYHSPVDRIAPFPPFNGRGLLPVCWLAGCTPLRDH